MSWSGYLGEFRLPRSPSPLSCAGESPRCRRRRRSGDARRECSSVRARAPSPGPLLEVRTSLMKMPQTPGRHAHWPLDARSLTSDQEAPIAGQFPGLEEQLLGCLQQWLVDVRSRVEEADLDGSELFLDSREYALDLFFLAGIDTERMNIMSRSPQLAHKPVRLGRVTPADANRIAALRKTPGDGRSDGVAGAHKYRYAAALRHPASPIKFLFDTLIVTTVWRIVNDGVQRMPAGIGNKDCPFRHCEAWTKN